jgi:hypothetical protein
MFESLLQMNEGAGSLDQALEKIRVAGASFQPKLLENIVRFIITLLVPAQEKGAIKWMLCHVGPGKDDTFRAQLGHESRNPLAFVHEELNLPTAQTMSKQARISFPGKSFWSASRHRGIRALESGDPAPPALHS